MNTALKEWFAGGLTPVVTRPDRPGRHLVVRFGLGGPTSATSFGHLACAHDSALALASAGVTAIVSSGHFSEGAPAARALSEACRCRRDATKVGAGAAG
jgi:hypothetical protein